jgi:hypothetical protein
MTTSLGKENTLVTLVYREVTYFSRVVTTEEYEEIKKTDETDVEAFASIHDKMNTHKSYGPLGYVAFQGDVANYLPDLVEKVESNGEFEERLCESLFIEPDGELINTLDGEFQEYSKLFSWGKIGLTDPD